MRQTISKWEQGLSVPDAEMLVSLSSVFDTPVSTLLGENIVEETPDNLKEISQKLELINLQLAERRENRRKFWHLFFIMLCVTILLIFGSVVLTGNTYMTWDYNDHELAVLGVSIHAFIWIFMRIFPFALIGSIIGICLTIKKK